MVAAVADEAGSSSFEPAPGLVATAMVTPLLATSVVDASAGHDVLPQSRPTRQQPPRKTAAHW